MRRSLALCSLLVFSFAACGDDDPIVPGTDVSTDTSGDAGGDTTGGDTADVGEDVDAPETDTTVDTRPSAECGNGVVEEGEECDAPEDDRCSDECTVAVEGAGVCEACTTDLDCGGATDLCISVGGESVCGQDCSEAGCPGGYTCGPVVRDGVRFPDQCKPIEDACGECDDTDEDGVCDRDDACEGFDDANDLDADGTPDDCDECPLDENDDSDGDGTCDSEDLCPGGADTADIDEDGVPNACDDCPFSNPDDADEDGVCGNVDRCEGHDDTVDVDMDEIPDGCDESVEICADDIDNDGDEIVDCLDTDCARHTDCGPCDAPLEIGVGTVTGETEEGTDELAPGDSACGWVGGSEAVYAFVAEADGTYCATTAGTEFDTVLYARTTCDDPETELICNDDGGDMLTSEFEFDATVGAPVFLVVDGYDEFEFGAYSLSVFATDCAAAASAALCGAAEAIGNGTFDGELGETSYSDSKSCRGTGGGEVAYAYTAPTTGTVCVSARGTDVEFPLDTIVYVRSVCADRTSEIACNDNIDIDDYASQVELSVTADEVYYVFVDEYADPGWGWGGPYELTIADGECP